MTTDAEHFADLILERVGVVERIVPGLIATCERLTAEAHRKAGEMGVTPDEFRAMNFDQREHVLLAWSRKHRRRRLSPGPIGG